MVLYRGASANRLRDVSENKALMVAQGRRRDGGGSILRSKYTIQMSAAGRDEAAHCSVLSVCFRPCRPRTFLYNTCVRPPQGVPVIAPPGWNLLVARVIGSCQPLARETGGPRVFYPELLTLSHATASFRNQSYSAGCNRRASGSLTWR